MEALEEMIARADSDADGKVTEDDFYVSGLVEQFEGKRFDLAGRKNWQPSFKEMQLQEELPSCHEKPTQKGDYVGYYMISVS